MKYFIIPFSWLVLKQAHLRALILGLGCFRGLSQSPLTAGNKFRRLTPNARRSDRQAPNQARFKKFSLALGLVVLLFAQSAMGRGRRIAVLEYRAGVQGAPTISSGMAQEINRLTSNTVISPSEARRRLGPSTDAEVAKCKGQSRCIAEIGKQLQCDEVILVGISQLGDLILAIQRISVHSGAVLNRLADSLMANQKIPRKTLQQYLKRLLPPSDFIRYGRIVVKTSQEGDSVFLEDKLYGKTPLAPIVVSAPGRYNLRVQRPQHDDFSATIDVMPDTSVEVAATLSFKVAPLKWYQKWWVWAIVGFAVTSTAAAVTAYSISSGGPDSVPVVIHF